MLPSSAPSSRKGRRGGYRVGGAHGERERRGTAVGSSLSMSIAAKSLSNITLTTSPVQPLKMVDDPRLKKRLKKRPVPLAPISIESPTLTTQLSDGYDSLPNQLGHT